jgi:bacterioferritin
MSEKLFLFDAQTLRQRTRQYMEESEANDGYTPYRQTVLKLLNSALTAEMLCVQRYQRYQFLTTEGDPAGIARKFVAHADDEQRHADQIAARIVKLDGEPGFSPEGLMSCTHTAQVNDKSLIDMIKDDIVAECIVNDNYRDIIRFLGERDPETQSLLAEILAGERAHAAEMATLLESPAAR